MKLFIFLLLFSHLTYARTAYYQLTTKIGDNVFKDLLILDDLEKQNSTLTVPGQFSTRLRALEINEESKIKHIKFEFKAIENNQDLAGSYTIDILENKNVSGILKIEDQVFPIEGKEIYAE